MILILSQDSWEITTEEVQDWIEALGGVSVRLNGEDLNGGGLFTISYDSNDMRLHLELGNETIDLQEINTVWMRRWHAYRNLSFLEKVDDQNVARDMRLHLTDEIRALTGGLEIILKKATWLSSLHRRVINKLESLLLARNAGLEIPATMITSNKQDLKEFKSRYERIVTKAASEARAFSYRGTEYPMFTVEVDQSLMESAPERFFPSLLQELLVKDYEIRTFYLNGQCYSMAIFSQLDPKTEIDFRHYNRSCPNRNVPYRLPVDIERNIVIFMGLLGLETGSLDFVRTKDGRHVFLEVNPVGQFRMVSEPCNYLLEKKVAEHLVSLDENARH